ncbi:MAG: 2-oxoglutarate dehydrogenase complex dihydrolipoyllysine-residue succinyltransferase [Rickettsiales bacterium]|nr:2-oxoglutarate dehydrogenase complex dihydrolipoyllysine-residue succinyltransferase [Rickettsiales bacterium]
MSTDIKTPDLGESVTEATIASWFKAEGDTVAKDEPICELETDKVTLEVPAPANGVLEKIIAKEGDTVEKGSTLGSIKEGAAPEKSATEPKAAAAAPPASAPVGGKKNPPAVEKIASEKGLNLSGSTGSGKQGRHTKADVLAMSSGEVPAAAGPREERVKMTKLRQAIARRLKESQNTAAILTTFNEIDMSRVKALRAEHKEAFEKKFGVRLGFMGIFAKASVQALKEIPEVNAHIEGDEVVYKNHYDIGMAVGTPQGLVVPVIRDCDTKSLAQIEASIAEMAGKARDGSLSMADMTGGTFTISNGGVYGSLMATPIINPPQSGILGIHKIEDRPVVVNGEIVIRPMMYIALSYDHRIIDGRESVTFLKRVKEMIEDPARLMMGI